MTTTVLSWDQCCSGSLEWFKTTNAGLVRKPTVLFSKLETWKIEYEIGSHFKFAIDEWVPSHICALKTPSPRYSSFGAESTRWKKAFLRHCNRGNFAFFKLQQETILTKYDCPCISFSTLQPIADTNKDDCYDDNNDADDNQTHDTRRDFSGARAGCTYSRKISILLKSSRHEWTA